jgi:uncharacterized integral membrane protein
VVKSRVLRISDAFYIAGFGLVLISLILSESPWRALSNGGTFVQIGGVFSFEVLWEDAIGAYLFRGHTSLEAVIKY